MGHIGDENRAKRNQDANSHNWPVIPQATVQVEAGGSRLEATEPARGTGTLPRMALVSFLLAVSACAHAPGIPIPVPLADAIEQAWSEAGLPDAEGQLNGVRVLFASERDFRFYCSNYPSEAAACATEATEQHGVKVDAVPMIVIAPGVEVDSRGEPIVHEAGHLLTVALLRRKSPDGADVGHQDERVWSARDPHGSAQARARVRVVEAGPAALEGMTSGGAQ